MTQAEILSGFMKYVWGCEEPDVDLYEKFSNASVVAKAMGATKLGKTYWRFPDGSSLYIREDGRGIEETTLKVI